MDDNQDRGSASTLRTATALRVNVGVLWDGPVLDADTGRHLGTSQRTKWVPGGGFLLLDAEQDTVLRVTRFPLSYRWTVFGGSDHRKLGRIVEAPRRRWPLFRMMPTPWNWSGSMWLDGKEVGRIGHGGVVMDPASGKRLAALSLGTPAGKATKATWILRLNPTVHGSLRVMVLAWLAVAFDLAHDHDTDG